MAQLAIFIWPRLLTTLWYSIAQLKKKKMTGTTIYHLSGGCTGLVLCKVRLVSTSYVCCRWNWTYLGRTACGCEGYWRGGVRRPSWKTRRFWRWPTRYRFKVLTNGDIVLLFFSYLIKALCALDRPFIHVSLEYLPRYCDLPGAV